MPMQPYRTVHAGPNTQFYHNAKIHSLILESVTVLAASISVSSISCTCELPILVIELM